jgi:XRE family aerobic/anaerobic benzoate catabolism transcriptional regulator
MHYSTSSQEADDESVNNVASLSAEMANRIRAARARIGMTRKQLAAASRASERYLAHLEAGTGNPSLEMLYAIAEALDLAPADLLPRGGERSEETAQAAALLRRLQPDRLAEAIGWLQRPVLGEGGKAQRVALVGLRGAGKSSLGRELAKRLGQPFFEISKEVERRYGGSIGVLLEMNGQGALRRYEAEVLEEICRSNRAAVIAAPGAIVSDGALYDSLLGSAWSIWLGATPEDHMSRVMAQGDLRPMSGNRSAMNDLRKILEARTPDYARADARLDTSAQDFAATLDKLEILARSFAT